MAHQIEYTDWGKSGVETFTTDRMYEEYTVHAEKQPESRGWGVGASMVTLTLFVDTQTGLVTTDVAAFEKWIKEQHTPWKGL